MKKSNSNKKSDSPEMKILEFRRAQSAKCKAQDDIEIKITNFTSSPDVKSTIEMVNDRLKDMRVDEKPDEVSYSWLMNKF